MRPGEAQSLRLAKASKIIHHGKWLSLRQRANRLRLGRPVSVGTCCKGVCNLVAGKSLAVDAVMFGPQLLSRLG